MVSPFIQYYCIALQLASIGLIGFAMRFLVELGYVGPVIGTNSPFYISAITTLAGVITFVMTPLGLFSMITFRKTMMLAVRTYPDPKISGFSTV